jgi:hypothetical protein
MRATSGHVRLYEIDRIISRALAYAIVTTVDQATYRSGSPAAQLNRRIRPAR